MTQRDSYPCPYIVDVAQPDRGSLPPDRARDGEFGLWPAIIIVCTSSAVGWYLIDVLLARWSLS